MATGSRPETASPQSRWARGCIRGAGLALGGGIIAAYHILLSAIPATKFASADDDMLNVTYGLLASLAFVLAVGGSIIWAAVRWADKVGK